jgi:hypothetical protein
MYVCTRQAVLSCTTMTSTRALGEVPWSDHTYLNDLRVYNRAECEAGGASAHRPHHRSTRGPGAFWWCASRLLELVVASGAPPPTTWHAYETRCCGARGLLRFHLFLAEPCTSHCVRVSRWLGQVISSTTSHRASHHHSSRHVDVDSAMVTSHTHQHKGPTSCARPCMVHDPLGSHGVG